MAKSDRVVGGVDTHKDVHVAAVVDEVGRILGTESFATTVKDYERPTRWLCSFGQVVKVGVEGTGAYGGGLARHLLDSGIEVIEVNRPNRQMRRRRGKSDTVDAEAAARAALNGEATTAPKATAGIVESTRVLRVALCSARDDRARVALRLRDLIVTAPGELRAALSPLATPERVARCARLRTSGDVADPVVATKLALRTLARRYEALSAEMAETSAALDQLTAQANPALRAAKGVGTDVAAILLVAAGENTDRLVPCSGEVGPHRQSAGGPPAADRHVTSYAWTTHEIVREATREIVLRNPPAELGRLVTWDQGAGRSRHAELTTAAGIRTSFCDLNSPGQRPFFPKGASLRAYSRADPSRRLAHLHTAARVKTLGRA